MYPITYPFTLMSGYSSCCLLRLIFQMWCKMCVFFVFFVRFLTTKKLKRPVNSTVDIKLSFRFFVVEYCSYYWYGGFCYLLFSDPFHRCSTDVDPAQFIKQCEHDVCECGTSATDVTGCECAAFARYARECQVKEATIDWRVEDLCCK